MFLRASEYTIKNLFLRNIKKKNPVTSINLLRLYHMIYMKLQNLYIKYIYL